MMVVVVMVVEVWCYKPIAKVQQQGLGLLSECVSLHLCV